MELGLGCVAHVLRAVWASGLSGCFDEGGGDDPGFFAMAAMVARSTRFYNDLTSDSFCPVLPMRLVATLLGIVLSVLKGLVPKLVEILAMPVMEFKQSTSKYTVARLEVDNSKKLSSCATGVAPIRSRGGRIGSLNDQQDH